MVGTRIAYSDERVENGEPPELTGKMSTVPWSIVGIFWGIAGVAYLLGRVP